MQFTAYEQLARTWKDRKEYLRSELARTEGAVLAAALEAIAELPVSMGESDAIRESKASRKAEQKRNKVSCEEMAEEERVCRLGYHMELLSTLRERRNMRDEDALSRTMNIDAENIQVNGAL